MRFYLFDSHILDIQRLAEIVTAVSLFFNLEFGIEYNEVIVSFEDATLRDIYFYLHMESI
jgi:hypothetical protein